MARSRNIRIYGKQRKELDADLMVQILIMLGHELDQENQIRAEKADPDTSKTRGEDQAEEDWS